MGKSECQPVDMGPRWGIRRNSRVLSLTLLAMSILGLGFLELRAQGNDGRVLTSSIGLLSHLFGSGVTPEKASHVSGTKYLFVFGDSYTATGFDINGTKPSTRNPIGNPDLPGWTSSGGLNWPGYLATELNTSLTYAYVLAVGGSTVDNSIIPAYSPWVPSLSDQVRTWTAHLAPRPGYTPWNPKNALFAVWIGVNDVGNSFSQPGEEVRLNRDLDRLFDLLGKLYANGARRFALLNIPRKSSPPASTSGSLLTDVD
jgi:hypothetical protein